MGEVIPGQCVTNALHENKHIWNLFFSDWERVQMWG